MPEKTRDRKSWFPRFKSNWLGTYRSKQMFACCECGVKHGDTSRYKGAEGKHCVCGKDQWHLAKAVEEAEYNRRMEISKALGGLRYDEALQRLKAMGATEHELERSRAFSDTGSVSSASDCGSSSSSSGCDPSHATTMYSNPPPSHHHSSASTPTFRHYESAPAALGKTTEYASYSTPVGADHLVALPTTDQFAPYALTEEDTMGFGEMLQDIMDDDGPRYYTTNTYAAASSYASSASPLYAPVSPPYVEANEYYGFAYPAYRDVPPYAMSHRHHAAFQPAYAPYGQPLTTAFASDL